MDQPEPNLGNLIEGLEWCSNIFASADRLEPPPQQRFGLKEYHLRMQQSAVAQSARREGYERLDQLAAMPGFDRIQIHCEAEWGEGVTLQNARRIRGMICKAGRSLEEANSMSLNSVADALDKPESTVNLPEREQNILEALGDKTLVAEELAPLAGYECNSRFRQTLSDMVKASKLVKVKRLGYRRA